MQVAHFGHLGHLWEQDSVGQLYKSKKIPDSHYGGGSLSGPCIPGLDCLREGAKDKNGNQYCAEWCCAPCRTYIRNVTRILDLKTSQAEMEIRPVVNGSQGKDINCLRVLVTRGPIQLEKNPGENPDKNPI